MCPIGVRGLFLSRVSFIVLGLKLFRIRYSILTSILLQFSMTLKRTVSFFLYKRSIRFRVTIKEQRVQRTGEENHSENDGTRINCTF